MGGKGNKRKVEDMSPEKAGGSGRIGNDQLVEGVLKSSSGLGGRAPRGGGSVGAPGSSRNKAEDDSGEGSVPKASRWWEEEESDEMSSGSGFETEVGEDQLDKDGPTSSSAAGRVDPFAMVPEVVMRDYLMTFLEDPKDRLNLARAFPSVAKFLGGDKMTSLYFCSVFPLPNFMNLLAPKEVLRLREVCQDWKKSIDKGLEEMVNPPEPNYRNYKSICNSSTTLALGHGGLPRVELLPRTQLQNPDRLDQLVSNILAGNASVTPFVLKWACVCISAEVRAEDDEPNWGKLFTVLRKFGRDIRYLRCLCLVQADMATLPGYLELLPLLTGLNFGLVDLDDGQAPPAVPLPPLPNLTKLRIVTLWLPLFHPFLLYFDQLVSLDVLNSFGFMEWLDPGTHSTFPNLKHLAIHITGWEQLRKLQLLASPLRDLSIGCHRGPASNICPSFHLYFLGHFKGTLSSFKINQKFDCTEPLRTLETFGLPEQARIDLPQLKTFSFNINECGYGSVDHLLKLSTPPEYLELWVNKCTPFRGPCDHQRNFGNEIIQVHGGCWRHMYTSNVWNLLPSLKEIQVYEQVDVEISSMKKYHYTRQQYEMAIGTSST